MWSPFGPEKQGTGPSISQNAPLSGLDGVACLPSALGAPILTALLGFHAWLQPSLSAAISGFEAGDSPDKGATAGGGASGVPAQVCGDYLRGLIKMPCPQLDYE